MSNSKNQDNNAKGWDAIDVALSNIYSDQEPQHYAPTLYYALGGTEPLDGISVYKNEMNKFYHYITYGFSELYQKETDDLKVSGFGFELTFRLHYENAETIYPVWPANFLQNIAKVVFKDGLVFNDYQTLNTGPIKGDSNTQVSGIIFIADPELKVIDTEYGEVKFLQIFGLTENEYEMIKGKQIDRRSWLSQVSKTNPFLVTDIHKK